MRRYRKQESIKEDRSNKTIRGETGGNWGKGRRKKGGRDYNRRDGRGGKEWFEMENKKILKQGGT